MRGDSLLRKRNQIVFLRLSPKELEHLKTQVKRSGLSREQYLRGLILECDIRARPCTHHADLLHKVAGLCNNANQLARVANTTGKAGAAQVEEMTRIARKVWEEVRQNW